MAAAALAAFAYRRYRSRVTDDDFVKPGEDMDSAGSIFSKLTNPFNRGRRNDYDDDFDKVL